MLKLYNTLTRQKDIFTPLDPKNVRMYVCGPTVYDFAHIGNARPVIVFDVLFRLLRHLYGEQYVTYVRNVTDVDDKINERATERGITIRELTEGTLAQYQTDTRALGCLDPTHQPRATEYISNAKASHDMIRLIETLIARGHAYEAEGHVLFSVPSMKDYGMLSRRPMDEMIAGARVDVAPFKKNPADFVLWKPSPLASSSEAVGQIKNDLPGWESPWGRGRPGWHIECSAMAAAFLGEEFDIHGGGIDLVFPHHENEIAQSCCAFGTKRMAQIWMHNGFLQMEGEKMSKSLGNFATIREVLNDWPADVVRLAMLKTHYRQPIDWTIRSLEEARKTLDEWAIFAPTPELANPSEKAVEALCDDLNTPKFVFEMHELKKKKEYEELRSSLNLLGFGLIVETTLTASGSSSFHAKSASIYPEELIQNLLSARNTARASKNFAESDRIRDELAQMGIRIKDNKDGSTSWEVI